MFVEYWKIDESLYSQLFIESSLKLHQILTEEQANEEEKRQHYETINTNNKGWYLTLKIGFDLFACFISCFIAYEYLTKTASNNLLEKKNSSDGNQSYDKIDNFICDKRLHALINSDLGDPDIPNNHVQDSLHVIEARNAFLLTLDS